MALRANLLVFLQAYDQSDSVDVDVTEAVSGWGKKGIK
jgi:hypothetical protein